MLTLDLNKICDSSKPVFLFGFFFGGAGWGGGGGGGRISCVNANFSAPSRHIYIIFENAGWGQFG